MYVCTCIYYKMVLQKAQSFTNYRNNTEQIQKLFHVTRQSYFDRNDTLLGNCCHFPPPIFLFLYPKATTRGSVNFRMTYGSSFLSIPLARKFLLATCSEREDTCCLLGLLGLL